MYKISFSAKILSFPKICCCCGTNNPAEKYRAVAKRVTGKRVIKTQSYSWSFPICIKCTGWLAADRLAKIIFFLFIITLVGCIYFFQQHMKDLFIKSICLGIVVLTFVFWRYSRTRALKIKPDSTCVNPPVRYLSWYGTVQYFAVSNFAFLQEFEKINAKKRIGSG